MFRLGSYCILLHLHGVAALTVRGECDLSDVISIPEGENGTALVVSSKVGDVNSDPVYHLLSTPRYAGLEKVFVQPLAPRFGKLEASIKGLARASAVQSAVGLTTGSKKVYCMAVSKDGAVVNESMKDYAGTEICSMDRKRILAGPRSRTFAANANVDLESMVKEDSLKTVNVKTLLAEHVHSKLHLLRLEGEGIDNVIIGDDTEFPDNEFSNDRVLQQFFAEGVYPSTLVFNYLFLGPDRLASIIQFIKANGYSMCFQDQDILASK